MSDAERLSYLRANSLREAARFATFPMSYNITKSVVDTICTQVLDQPVRTLEPCYERAAVTGAIASLCSQLAADRMIGSRHDQNSSTVSVGTIFTIVGGAIAGVSIEAVRAKREQNLLAKIERKHIEVNNMSDVQLLNHPMHQRHSY